MVGSDFDTDSIAAPSTLANYGMVVVLKLLKVKILTFCTICFCFVDEVDVGAFSSRSPKASRCNECYAVVICLNLTFFLHFQKDDIVDTPDPKEFKSKNRHCN